MKDVQTIQDKLFLLNDKIKWAEMFIAHAKADMHELQEYIFDTEEKDYTERFASMKR